MKLDLPLEEFKTLSDLANKRGATFDEEALQSLHTLLTDHSRAIGRLVAFGDWKFLMKLELSVEEFESLSEAANTKGRLVKRVTTQSVRTLLVDHSRALAKLVEFGETIEEDYANHREIRKAR